MREYRVVWEIDIYADSPENAARKARATMLDPESIADVFSVRDGSGETDTVDLSTIDGREVD